MKIFALYLRLDLKDKPEWFDDLRNKYSSTSILHITLIQPRYVNEGGIQILKDKISEVLNKEKVEDKKLVFNKTKLEWDEDDKEHLLMSFIQENQSVLNLQKSLMEALKNFDKYCNESTKEYEANFRPHLTIANQINSSSKDEILKLISENPTLEGDITDLVLAVVNEQTIQESENPNNWITFNI